MMDYTDRHCRYFLRLLSPSALLYTEMITAAAIVRGEAVNTAWTYGYDVVTDMQETKATLCQVAKA